MSGSLSYNPTAAHRLLKRKDLEGIEPKILAARDEMFQDIALLESPEVIPDEKRPLDAGFIELPRKLLDAYSRDRSASLIGKIQTVAAELRENIDRLLLLGIGGSYMGARALFEALCDPYHNELNRDERHGVPRLYFEGNVFERPD